MTSAPMTSPLGQTGVYGADLIRPVEDSADVAACFPLMRQLRPHLGSEAELVERWRRQGAAGYRLLAVWRADRPVALAGYRLQDNLVHGLHLYVDDLVSDESERSSGLGARLLAWLKDEGARLGCAKLILDTPLSNSLGHRFYFRQGMLATSLRFAVALDTGSVAVSRDACYGRGHE